MWPYAPLLIRWIQPLCPEFAISVFSAAFRMLSYHEMSATVYTCIALVCCTEVPRACMFSVWSMLHSSLAREGSIRSIHHSSHSTAVIHPFFPTGRRTCFARRGFGSVHRCCSSLAIFRAAGGYVSMASQPTSPPSLVICTTCANCDPLCYLCVVFLARHLSVDAWRDAIR